MLTSNDGASSLDTRSDGFEPYLDLSTSPKYECDSRSLSKASSYLDIDGLLEDSKRQHFLVVDEGLHDPCSPSDMHQFRQFSSVSTSGIDKELYCLVVVDNETGIPVRAATDSETEEVARLLADYEPYGLSACPPFQMHHMQQRHRLREECCEPEYQQQHYQQQQQQQQQQQCVQQCAQQQCAQHQVQNQMQQQMQQQVQQHQMHAAQHHSVQHSACDSAEVEQHSSDESALCQKPAPRPFNHKTGGPCDHCGAKESPQWRRGPPAKPVLCNACGTRYRRTNQLGAPQNGGSRASGAAAKRRCAPIDVQSHSSSEDLRTRCLKQQRMAASLVSCEA